MRRFALIFVLSLLAFLYAAPDVCAQFKEKPFTQSYNDKADSLATADSTDKLINFQEIFGGLAHKRPMRIGSMFGTSMVLPGTAQIYNGQYWKLPIFYGGMAAGITGGIVFNNKYKSGGIKADKTASTLCFVGAGIMYYASLMDGVMSYKTDRKPHPGRATIYSILCPGLGQAYNREYWKIPIYIGGIVGSVHFLSVNQKNYIRFRDIYREASEAGYSGPVSGEQAKYYRDTYRRYRDYSIVAVAAFYLLQIIDANVFCYMNDFNVSEDLAMKVSPTVILPSDNNFAMARPAAGMNFSLRF